MIYSSENEILNNEGLEENNGELFIKDKDFFLKTNVKKLVDTIIFAESSHLKKLCHYVTYNAAIQLGVFPSSIQSLYTAVGKGLVNGFTIPAINIRTLTYDLARAVFKAAKKNNSSAFIFEIAKSEMGYTFQHPAEYSSAIMLAAMKEGYTGPIFIQGDHFNIDQKKYLLNKDAEIDTLKKIIKDAIKSSFYNIDIDSSALVDISKTSLDEQQKDNYKVCAFLTKFIRDIQPEGIEVSIGGEIGEVGLKNTSPDELKTFMEGYLKALNGINGISKISVQTGTSHGGVVLPDGSIAKVNIDFDTLSELSRIARNDYALAGAVQHGASTLPNEAFHRFPENKCIEIHLATQFQNMVYNYLPLSLKEKIYAWLHRNCEKERNPDWTEDQFIYKTRKKALGFFKKDIFSISTELKEKISLALEDEFCFLFEQLNIKNTKELIQNYINTVVIHKNKDFFLKQEK